MGGEFSPDFTLSASGTRERYEKRLKELEGQPNCVLLTYAYGVGVLAYKSLPEFDGLVDLEKPVYFSSAVKPYLHRVPRYITELRNNILENTSNNFEPVSLPVFSIQCLSDAEASIVLQLINKQIITVQKIRFVQEMAKIQPGEEMSEKIRPMKVKLLEQKTKAGKLSLWTEIVTIFDSQRQKIIAQSEGRIFDLALVGLSRVSRLTNTADRIDLLRTLNNLVKETNRLLILASEAGFF